MDTLSLSDRLEVSDDPTHSVSYLASALQAKLSALLVDLWLSTGLSWLDRD